MYLPFLLQRVARQFRWRAVLLALLPVVLYIAAVIAIERIAEGQIQIQGFGRWPPNAEESTAGVYLPSDRAISRAIERARERLKEGEYHEALSFLHGLLGREEDWFLERGGEGRGQLGVKATARQLIGELPPEGHAAYELLHGAAARRQLEAALKNGDRDGVSEVVRQFFHTAAGYEAALVLAQIEADQGHRLAAAQLYRELLDSPLAVQQFDPQLSLLAALNHLAAGQKADAARVMKALIERDPAVQFTLSGKNQLAPGVNSDQVAWLLENVGEPSEKTPNDVNWLSVRGTAARNVDTPGGRPHLRARWQARVINDPGTETYLSARNDDYTQRGVVVLPGARPIAVGDMVVMRTPENIVAVDWQSGKRIWETREEDDLLGDDSSSELLGQVDREQWAAQGNPLEERVWDDTLAMSLSSDGERVYLLRGMAANDIQQAVQWGMGGAFGPMGVEGAATTNQLAAYDMATQGKLVWELDGSRAAPPLDGAFFLGAPLAIDNTLYVMAEIRSAIYLLALDPATGKVQWQQQLVGLEQSIGLDPMRRRSGATPSYSGGIMVCPTAASAVIAIDVLKREFAWVYRYSREAQSTAEIRNMWQNTAQTPLVRANDRWLDGTAVIGEGHVFLTPPESGELHCVELQSGRSSWKRRQGDALFVGCVDGGNVLLVGADTVQALKVADGATAWPLESVRLPTGAWAAGQGYLSEGQYYLPLTTGDIAAIEMKTGKMTIHPSPKTGTKLGNLISHRGSILSQSPLVLDKFEQLDVLQKRTEEALDANPNDPVALRELAELKRTEGDLAKSVTLLKRAYEMAPADGLTQEMLVESLLETLADDYEAFREDVPLVARLVRDRQQQIELLRIEARGLDKLGQRLAAFDAYLKLADFTAEEPAALRIASEYSARSDRWICGQLGELWDALSPEEQSAITEKLVARRPDLVNPRTAAELRHYLAHLDELLGAGDVRAALATYLVNRERNQEAEVEILQLAESAKATHREIASKLSNRLEKTAALSERGTRTNNAWPRGVVKAELIPAKPQEPDARGGGRQSEKLAGYRQLRIEQDSSTGDAANIQWYVAMDCSEIVGRNLLGDDVFHLAVDQNSWARPHRDSNLVHAARLGHLLYVAMGGRVTAIESPGEVAGEASDVLWQTDPMNRYSSEAQQPRREAGDVPVRANRRPVYHTWSPRRRMIGTVSSGVYSLGPVTPRGVVFQEHDQLKCVDPLTGDVYWTRADIPLGCELFGDSQFVFAADASARIAHVIRMVDGKLIGKRELPRHEWLMTAGRNVAEVGFEATGNNRELLIRVTDIESQDVLFEEKFAQASRVTVVEPNLVAVFEPTGEFKLINVRDGEVVIDQQLRAVGDANGVYAMPSGERLFLFISSAPNQQFKPLVQQSDFPLVNGLVYAFDMKSGETIWPEPAVVRNRGVVLSQPQEIPLLMFADRKLVRDATTGGGSQLRVLCLDKRTGEAVFSNDTLADTSITRFRIRGERAGDSSVSIDMSANRILLTLTDEPRLAGSPANDDTAVATQPEVKDTGLGGIGRRITGAIQEALEKASEPDVAPVVEPDDD